MANGNTPYINPNLFVPVTGQVPGVTPLPSINWQSLQQYLPQVQQQAQQQLQRLQTQQPQIQSQPTNVSGRQPASIRYNNPGAMWPSSSSAKFGSNTHGVLSDGNRIAYFPDPVSGAAAQFDELSQPRYIGKPIGDLIDMWSGHTGGTQNVASYANHVAQSIGLSVNDRLTPQLLQSPAGIAFAKAQAQFETGSQYPLTDQQWTQAQSMAFGTQAQQQPQTALAQARQPARTVGDLMQSQAQTQPQTSQVLPLAQMGAFPHMTVGDLMQFMGK